MKKIFTIICAVFAALAVVSCAKKEETDEFGWYSDFGAARKAAQKDNKSIILYFSAVDSDNVSADWNDKIFKTTEFKEKFSPDFVFCNLDFSDSRFNDVYGAEDDANSDSGDASDEENDENAAKKSQRSAKETSRLQQKLAEDMLLPSYYAVESLPAVRLLTKQGYVISPLLIEENYDIDDVQAEIEKVAERRTQITNLLTTISTGKKDEALNAIDELYDSTEDEYKFLLADLHEQFIKLDKKNESGRTVDHIFQLANARAQEAFFENDIEKAVEKLETPLKYDILTPENRLQAYYSVGYFLAMSGSTDYDRIISYFQKAHDADPESEYAEYLSQMIDNLNEMKAQQGLTAETDNNSPNGETESK